MAEEHELKPNQRAVYFEDNGRDLVEILENVSDEKMIRYNLRIVGIIWPSDNSFVKPHRVGDEFECEKLRGINYSGAWHIESFEKYNKLKGPLGELEGKL